MFNSSRYWYLYKYRVPRSARCTDIAAHFISPIRDNVGITPDQRLECFPQAGEA